MTDPSKADKEEKKKISKDAPKRDPKHDEEARKIAEAADEEDGAPKLARDRQPLPDRSAGSKDDSASDTEERKPEDRKPEDKKKDAS